MKLEKKRYEDVLILRFVGEFDTFNLPAFTERVESMVEAGDVKFLGPADQTVERYFESFHATPH